MEKSKRTFFKFDEIKKKIKIFWKFSEMRRLGFLPSAPDKSSGTSFHQVFILKDKTKTFKFLQIFYWYEKRRWFLSQLHFSIGKLMNIYTFYSIKIHYAWCLLLIENKKDCEVLWVCASSMFSWSLTVFVKLSWKLLSFRPQSHNVANEIGGNEMNRKRFQRSLIVVYFFSTEDEERGKFSFESNF